jgi:hypothetical protein
MFEIGRELIKGTSLNSKISCIETLLKYIESVEST